MRRRRRLLTVVLTVAACAIAPAAAQAAGWIPGPDIADAGLTGAADMATDAAGVTTVVWVERLLDGDGVIARRLQPDGALGPRLPLGRGGWPDVAVTPGGTAVVSWIEPADGSSTLKLRTIAPDGAVRPTPVAVATLDAEPVLEHVATAVAPDGSALATWSLAADGALHARRVAPDGTPDAPVVLGPAGGDDRAYAALADDGAGFVAWTDRTGDAQPRYARLTAAGALDGGGQLADAGYAANAVAGAAGGLLVWYERSDDHSSEMAIRAVRLPASGGATVPIATLDVGSYDVTAHETVPATLAPDGTATLLYGPQGEFEGYGATTVARQVTPSGAVGAPLELAPPGRLYLPYQLVRRGDGTLLPLWLSLSPATPATVAFDALPLAADGSARGPAAAPFAPVSTGGLGAIVLAAGGQTAVAGLVQPGATGRFRTAFFDDAPPRLEVSAPAAVARGEAATFAATADDSSGVAEIAWQFGDGATATGAAASHVYTGTGSYTVTVTATDAVGERTVVTRTVAVADRRRRPVRPARLDRRRRRARRRRAREPRRG